MMTESIMADVNLDNTIIDKLNDYDKAIELMDELGLDSDEIENVEEARHQLRIYLSNQHEEDGSPKGRERSGSRYLYKMTADKSTKMIEHMMTENCTKRMNLKQLVLECQTMIDRLPDPTLKDLNAVYPNAKDDLKMIVNELEVNECVILVAGETGAGKSTLLNLLLGELATELLPVAHLSSTSAITELRYWPYPKLIVHYRDPSIQPIEVDLKNMDKGTVAQTISEHVHQKDKRGESSFEFSKVEVYWDCVWLKGGITIVDSPGVGEDNELTEMVKQYLPKASGFIYVINTPNAGGIDPDRLQDLLLSHRVKQKEEGLTGEFNPGSAVFVCNKWDDVPVSEQPSVREYVMKQLHNVWTGFTEEQVFFMSAEQARKQLRDNMVAQDYRALLEGIERLVPYGLNNKLARQYSAAWKMMDRCRLNLRTLISSGDMKTEVLKKRVKEGRMRLDVLAKQPHQLEMNLFKHMNEGICEAKQALNKHLRSDEVRTRLSTWSRRDCQVMVRGNISSLEALQEKMTANVMKRIKIEINDWDTDKQVFQKMRDNLLLMFKKEYLNIDRELRNIEDAINTDEQDPIMKRIVEDLRQHQNDTVDINLDFSLKQKLVMGFTAPLWVPVGMVLGITVLPVVGIKSLHKRLQASKQINKVKENIEQQMTDLTNHLLDELLSSEKLANALQDQIEELNKSFRTLLDEIPRLIEADRKVFDEMLKEVAVGAHQKQVAVYKPLLVELEDLITSMNFLYFTAIRAFDIEYTSLDNYQYLDAGSFARVYTADWSHHKDNLPNPLKVAIKSMEKPVTRWNTNDVLTEEDNFVRLQSANVVRFFGTGVIRTEGKVLPFFVMEYCPGTLADYVYKQSYRAPARNQRYMSMAARYASQVSAGLAKIHEFGYLHRDVKPANILVDASGVVKLADLGFAKKVEDVTGTIVGSPLYMAPEVFTGEPYNEKADMFSYGMLLWELWYGECVIEVYKVHRLDKFLTNPFPHDLKPEGPYKDLMMKCWSRNPTNRPSAAKCYEVINNNNAIEMN